MDGVYYTSSLADVSAEDLRGGFFEGWPEPPSPETHLRLLQGSDHDVVAADERTGEVAGFATAVSDGVLSAYIPLLEVLPRYRGRGIGGELVRRMLERLDGLYMVDLLCDPGLQPFYARLGMREAAGMARRDRGRLSGL